MRKISGKMSAIAVAAVAAAGAVSGGAYAAVNIIKSAAEEIDDPIPVMESIEEKGDLNDGSVTYEDGVMTLNGHVTLDQIRKYKYDTQLKTVIAEKGTVLPSDCSLLFYGCKAEVIDLDNADTSNVENMYEMFSFCTNLKQLKISNFNTSKVTNMRGMFKYYEPEELDVSSFDTSNVTNFSEMFYDAKNLKTLDLSKFSTEKAEDMSYMLYCSYHSAMTSLKLGKMDNPVLTDTSYMFYRLDNLKKLNLTDFNTSNVQNMSFMFAFCTKLETISIDKTSFITSNTTNTGAMFGWCSSLKNIDLSGIDTSNVKDMNRMFVSCSSLEKIDLSRFNTSNVQNIYGIFSDCKNLKYVDVTGFDMHKVTGGYGADGSGMFDYSTELLKNRSILNESSVYSLTDETIVVRNSCTIAENADHVVISGPSGDVIIDDLQSAYDEDTLYSFDYKFALKSSDDDGNYTVELKFYDKSGRQLIVTDTDGKLLGFSKIISEGNTKDETITRNCLTLNFDADGGTGIMENWYLPAGTIILPEECLFTPPEKHSWKKCWSIDGKVYEAGESVIVDQDTVIKPVWEKEHLSFDKENYTLTLNGAVTAEEIKSIGNTYYIHKIIAAEGSSLTGDVTKLFSSNFGKLEEVDLTAMDMSAITDMTKMFYYSYAKKVDLSGIDTSNVTSMESMFDTADELESISMSGCDLSNVKNANHMFFKCKKITEIDFGGFDFSSLEKANSMFADCISLTSVKFGSTTSKLANTCDMFRGCKVLKSADVSEMNTEGNQKISGMFADCPELSLLDLTGFDTSSVEDYNYTFRQCTKLLADINVMYSMSVEKGYTTKVRTYVKPAENAVKAVLTAGNSTQEYVFKDIPHDTSGRVCLSYSIKSGDTDANDVLKIKFFDSEGRQLIVTDEKGKLLSHSEISRTLNDVPRDLVRITKAVGGTGLGYFTEDHYIGEKIILDESFWVSDVPMPMDSVLIGWEVDGETHLITDKFEYEVTHDTTITPVMNNIGAHINVIFTDKSYNKLPESKAVILSDLSSFEENDISVPVPVYLDGYTFSGWEFNNKLYTDEAELKSDIKTVLNSMAGWYPEDCCDIYIHAVYEKKTASYTVTVINGSFKDDSANGTFNVSDNVCVIPDELSEGKTFAYWMIGNQIVSYNESYSFLMPAGDVTITAVYFDDVVAITEYEPVGTAYIESVKNVGNDSLVFVSKFAIPDGCRITKAGVVAAMKTDLGDNELTVENALYKSYDTEECYSFLAYKYTWTKVNIADPNEEWCVCPYLEYIDKYGDTHVVYGEMKTSSLASAETE